MKQLPDKRLARPGRLPSDIDGDMPQAEYEALCKQKQAKGVNCMDIEVVRKAAERIRKRQYDESNDGYEEFLKDEKVVVLWAIAELARRDKEAAERAMPITEEWLRSVGATIDVEDGVIEFRWLPGELVMTGGGFVVWTIDCVETGKVCTRGNLLDLRAALKGVEA